MGMPRKSCVSYPMSVLLLSYIYLSTCTCHLLIIHTLLHKEKGKRGKKCWPGPWSGPTGSTAGWPGPQPGRPGRAPVVGWISGDSGVPLGSSSSLPPSTIASIGAAPSSPPLPRAFPPLEPPQTPLHHRSGTLEDLHQGIWSLSSPIWRSWAFSPQASSWCSSCSLGQGRAMSSGIPPPLLPTS